MTAPDLTTFTRSRKKLQAEVLGHRKPEISTYSVLMAHFIDFWMAYCSAAFIAAFFQNIFANLMMTDQLERAFARMGHEPQFIFTLVVTMFSYFFFSHFFNGGQTFGMKMMKLRYVLAHHSFTESLKATMASFSIYMTGGFALKQVKASFASQDHLYHQLMQIKEVNAFDLVSKVEETEEVFSESRAA